MAMPVGRTVGEEASPRKGEAGVDKKAAANTREVSDRLARPAGTSTGVKKRVRERIWRPMEKSPKVSRLNISPVKGFSVSVAEAVRGQEPDSQMVTVRDCGPEWF